jgi:branched-chain amino acid transport system substrate-binding protein
MPQSRRRFLAQSGTIAALASVGFPNVVLAKGEPIRVGIIPPITGSNALNGQLEMEGAKYALSEINGRPGKAYDDRPFELVVEDATNDNQAAVAALNKLIGENIVAVVVPVLSTQIQAMAPVMKQAGLPWMTGGTAVKNTRLGVRNLFRLRASDGITAKGIVDFAVKDKKLTKIGILHSSEAFGTGGADSVEASLLPYNLKAVAREAYPVDTKDFTPELLRIKNAGADGIIAYVQNPSDCAVILNQYRELGLTKIAFIGSPSFGNATGLQTAGAAANGVYVAQDFIVGKNGPVASKFLDNFQKEFHHMPDVGVGQGWTRDSFVLLADTYKRIGTTDPAKTVDALHETKNWQGVLGSLTCDSEGNMVHSMSVGIVENAKVTLVKTVTVAV